MELKDQILALKNQLFPKGRAFKNIVDGVRTMFLQGLIGDETVLGGEAKAFQDALDCLDSILPDNDGFDEADASAWERVYGLQDGGLANLDLPTRKALILQHINFPDGQPARQHYLFIQDQLRKAGFTDVYVFENRFPDGMGGYHTKSPLDYTTNTNQLGEREFGEVQFGDNFTNIIANSLDPDIDATFDTGSNLRSTFFISGSPLGTTLTYPKSLETSFRQAVLRLKPCQTVAFSFINFT